MGELQVQLATIENQLERPKSNSSDILKQVLEKGPALKMFKEAHRLFTQGHEDQALSRYIYLAAQGFEVANFNAAFILENSKDPSRFGRAKSSSSLSIHSNLKNY